MADNDYIHAEMISKLMQDMLKLSDTINGIQNSVRNLDNKLEDLTKVKVVNGGGIPAIASLPEAVKILIDNIDTISKQVNDLDKKVAITPEKVKCIVEENIDMIVDLVDEYREENKDKGYQHKNNKMQYFQNILFFVSILVNIIMFIHLNIRK